MKYQVAERGYAPSEMYPGGLKYILDPFETLEDAQYAIMKMLEQAKEDGYEDSIDNYAIVELHEDDILPPPRLQKLTNEIDWYAGAAGMTEKEAKEQLAEAEDERERVKRLNNNEYLKEQWKES